MKTSSVLVFAVLLSLSCCYSNEESLTSTISIIYGSSKTPDKLYTNVTSPNSETVVCKISGKSGDRLLFSIFAVKKNSFLQNGAFEVSIVDSGISCPKNQFTEKSQTVEQKNDQTILLTFSYGDNSKIRYLFTYVPPTQVTAEWSSLTSTKEKAESALLKELLERLEKFDINDKKYRESLLETEGNYYCYKNLDNKYIKLKGNDWLYFLSGEDHKIKLTKPLHAAIDSQCNVYLYKEHACVGLELRRKEKPVIERAADLLKLGWSKYP